MEHRHSLVIPPHFDGNNYTYWKVSLKAFLKSIDERIWNSIEYGWEKSTTPVSEWQTFQKALFNSFYQTLSFLKMHFFIMQFLKTPLFHYVLLQKTEPNTP